MGNTFASCFEEAEDVSNGVYRDEINEKNTSSVQNSSSSNGMLSPPFQDHIASHKFMSCSVQTGEDGYDCSKQEKGAVRVRIVLTKQELAQLISMSKGEEGVLAAILSELNKGKETDNGSSFSPRSSSDPWRPVLEMIPEES